MGKSVFITCRRCKFHWVRWVFTDAEIPKMCPVCRAMDWNKPPAEKQ